MTMTDTPSNPKPAADATLPGAEGQTVVVLTFEDRLQLFWRRNSALVIAGCIAVLLTIIGVGVWEYLAKQKEQDIRQAYGAAATPESLKTFAAAHAGHPLAGAAYLRMADDAFAEGKTADALSNYEKAAGIFKDGPLGARTKLGLAVTKVVGGKAAEGAAELKQIAEDANQFKGLRAEAAYHLASLAAESGAAADVVKYSDLLMQIDPASTWTQRGLGLRASLPAPAVAPGAQSTPPAIQIGPMVK